MEWIPAIVLIIALGLATYVITQAIARTGRGASAEELARATEKARQLEAQLTELAPLRAATEQLTRELATAQATLAAKTEQLATAHAAQTEQQAELDQLRALRATLEAREVTLKEQIAAQATLIEQVKQDMKAVFESLAAATLESTRSAFQQSAQSDYQLRESRLDALLKPVSETLTKLESQTQGLATQSSEQLGIFSTRVEHLLDAHTKLSTETRRLTEAMKSNKARGRFGEIAVGRLLELAGLSGRYSVREQETLRDGEGGRLRPDFIVDMPGERSLVIDVKYPGSYYLALHETEDEAERKKATQDHARAVQERVNELASKAYQDQLVNAAEFVVMFVPNDSFLAAAVDHAPELVEKALERRVIIVTPSSLMALLQLVSLGWRQQEGIANAEEIRLLGEELCLRLGTFLEHLKKVGTSLDKAQETYGDALGALESRVLVTARKFQKLGVKTRKDLTTALTGEIEEESALAGPASPPKPLGEMPQTAGATPPPLILN